MVSILGLNAFHGDSAACLIRDGILIAAAEEERFRRIKHWAGFPSQAIAYCLQEAGIALADVDHVAVNQDARASLGRKILYTLTQRPDPRLVFDRLRNKVTVGKLFTDIGPRYNTRPGGYIRIVKCGYRTGDKAPMAYVELVDRPTNFTSDVAGDD